jgi:hypothetical protein
MATGTNRFPDPYLTDEAFQRALDQVRFEIGKKARQAVRNPDGPDTLMPNRPIRRGYHEQRNALWLTAQARLCT